MALLFIDSTYDIMVGLLNEKFSWIDLRHHSGQRTSSVLQMETHLLSKKHGIELKSLQGIVTVAGPGFYTGLRLSEGFSDIFKMFNVPIYSFYSYEIPRLSGHEKGVWLTKAYRGEYFLHSWGHEDRNELISSKEIISRLQELDHVFIHSPAALDETTLKIIKSSTSTSEILKENPFGVFSQVIALKLHRDSFYFRAPEDEFRTAQ